MKSIALAFTVSFLFTAPVFAQEAICDGACENNNATDAAQAVDDRQTTRGISDAMSGRTVIGHRQILQERTLVGGVMDKLRSISEKNKGDHQPTNLETEGELGQIQQ